MPNILPIKELAREIVLAIDTQEGELTPDVLDLFSQLEQKGAAAIAPLCDVVDELTLRAAARKDKAKQLSNLAKKDESMVENAKKYLIAIMQAVGQDKFQIGSLTVTLSKGRESVEVVNEDLIPMKYKTATIKLNGNDLDTAQTLFGDSITSTNIEVDKTAIKKATAENIGIAGTQIVRKPYIIIKG
jgi:hypothetical protein